MATFISREAASAMLGLQPKQFSRAVEKVGIVPIDFGNQNLRGTPPHIFIRSVIVENRDAIIAATGHVGRPRGSTFRKRRK